MKLDDLPVSHGVAADAGARRASDAAWRAVHDAAAAGYRAAGRFAWHFARGKLARDPVFRGLIERGDLGGVGVGVGGGARDDARGGADGGVRVVDIGCGQGLMASLLQACHDTAAAGHWPAVWPAAPQAASYLGIELMPRDVQRARLATASLALAPRFECNDMRRAALPPCERVVILDVLHYVDHAAQSALLTRVRDALLQGRPDVPRRLLLRVGDADNVRGFLVSQWVDRAVTFVRGHRAPPTWGRPLAAWVALLQELGFAVQRVPMSQGTPFANVLLVADVVGSA
jgi:SAM-dependent methyltransferase